MSFLPVRSFVDAILPPGDRRIAVVLFCAALLLYVPGIWWGLPYADAPDRIRPWGSDELAPLGPMAELYSVFVSGGPVFNPQYPLFHYLVLSLFVGPYIFVLWLVGDLGVPSTQYPFGLEDPVVSLAVMTMLCRIPSLLMAAGTVVAGFWTAAILWGRKTGVLAGITVLVCYSMAYYSRTSNVDMAALFWTSLGLWVFSVCLMDSLTTVRAFWLGVFAALAAATKDSAYAPFLACGLILVVKQLLVGRKTKEFWSSAKPLAAGLLSALLIYSVSSGALFRMDRYRSHLDFVLHGSRINPHFYHSFPGTVMGYASLTATTIAHTIDALSWPFALMSLLGMAVCIQKTPVTLLLVPAALAVVGGVILPVRYVQFRFVLVIAYILALYAARGVAELLTRRPGWRQRAAQFALVFMVGHSLVRGADLTWQMVNDSRYRAGEWLHRSIIPGDRIGHFGDASKLPRFRRQVQTVPMPGQLVRVSDSHSSDIKPEFVLVIPVQDFEKRHEWTVPESTYNELVNGSTGYQKILDIKPASLFSERPISFVNPPVTVFVRKDRLSGLPNGTLAHAAP